MEGPCGGTRCYGLCGTLWHHCGLIGLHAFRQSVETYRPIGIKLGGIQSFVCIEHIVINQFVIRNVMVSVQLSRQLDCCQCRHRRLQHLLGRTNFPPLSMFSDKNSKEALKLESGRLGFDALDCGFIRLRMTGMAYLWTHLWVILIFTS